MTLKHRFLALFTGAVLILAFLSGCSEPARKSVRFGLSAAPVTLDPRYATDATSYRITRLLYRSLIDFDRSFRPVPSLATWESISPSHFRFRLGSEGREFHDGARLMAEDVKTTYASVLDERNTSPHRGSLNMIQRIETPNQETVDFYLNKPDSLFPGRLVMGILPANLIRAGHKFNQLPVGSGPMRLVEWRKSGHLYLQRQTDGAEFEFLSVQNPTVRILKLLRGEIDLFQGDLPQEMIEWVAARPEVRVEKGRGSTFSYIGFNLQDPVLRTKEVRLAIAHAIDRDAIIEYVFRGSARKASAILPPNHWAGHPALGPYEYDPGKASRLIRAAGYSSDNPLRIRYKTSNNPFRVRLATIIQHQLSQAGISVDIQSYDWGTLYADIKEGRFQMFSLSWVGLKMPDIFRYAFHSESTPPDGANRGRFVDQKVDSLIEKAEKEDDLGVKAAIYRDLQSYLLEELPYVPLWYEDQVLTIRREYSGYTVAPDGNYDGLMTVKRNGES